MIFVKSGGLCYKNIGCESVKIVFICFFYGVRT